MDRAFPTVLHFFVMFRDLRIAKLRAASCGEQKNPKP